MFLGLLLAAIGGGLDASQALVMSIAKRWRWEAIWLVWAISGCFILPWATAFLLLRDPNPIEVYRAVSPKTLAMVALYGAGWGVGAVLFGLGIIRVGMGLGLGIVVSLTAANGTLLPLLLKHRDRLFTSEAAGVYLSVALLVLGIVLCSMAAHRRKDEKPLLEREPTNFVFGLLYCIASGFTSPMINLAFTEGMPIVEAAGKLGAGFLGAAVAPVAVLMTGGLVVNAIYCLYFLRRNGTWRDFKRRDTISHWFVGLAMGFLQLAGFVTMTVAASHMDSITSLSGTIIGWPVYTACVVLVGNIEGLLRGEWRGSDRSTFLLLAIGLSLVVIASAVVVGLGSYLTA